MTLKVAICDDDNTVSSQIEQVLQSYSKINFEIDVYYTPEKLMHALAYETYDFYILDIVFPTSSGLEIATTIRTINQTVPIIFLTTYSAYMEQVFKVNTFDYLLKPVLASDLTATLDRLTHYLQLSDATFQFQFNKIVYRIPLRRICYFEKCRRTVFIHLANGEEFETILTTKSLLEKLSADFVQIHHSYIINVTYIQKMSQKSMLLTSHKQQINLPMSRKFNSIAKEQILIRLRETI
ncbi:LytR/AlgR family response regulator transcription factor [Lactococcus paracarnosus]|uniref:Response regulator transcription factor n=1 Tax=Pseudolactococcus paracarnosus TaxID=2749962 RepID=A0A7L4WBT0_9LACT|nr:LytTR family DNA-binding domain-containing protein [Lactococcus paracarnosus]SPC36133.1 Response regulator [Lactococcus piscium]MCJ1977001.1 response regulator transcription factor [Lactococcus paracarnosus]MCJ1983412.1 response regulator transcription factor [Lactococcus paracarnosus]MCJ1993687.1 response regulator transcription factor [Lactococcus paracarnosus]MCJ1998788.1 response regulator transcription factor [Lactococcus paracarnosus]